MDWSFTGFHYLETAARFELKTYAVNCYPDILLNPLFVLMSFYPDPLVA